MLLLPEVLHTAFEKMRRTSYRSHYVNKLVLETTTRRELKPTLKVRASFLGSSTVAADTWVTDKRFPVAIIILAI